MDTSAAQWSAALRWVMTQPSMLEGLPGGHRPLLEDGDPRLERLMADTERAPEGLTALLAAPRAHKVGISFEALMHWGIERGLGHRVLGRDVQVHADKRTLGALDAVVQTESGSIEHWEFAYKLFLQCDGGIEWSSWVGPGARDRLDTKVNRMLEHQLPLSERPEAQAVLRSLGIERIDRRRMVLQGVLFSPWGCPPSRARGALEPCAGRWVHVGRIEEVFDAHPQSRWVKRNKPLWFGWWSGDPAAWLPPDAVRQALMADPVHRAQLWSVRLAADSDAEVLVFVVPDGWGQSER